MPLDPQVQQYLARQALEAGPPPKSAIERREVRRAQSIMRVENVEIDGPAGKVPLRIYKPGLTDGLPVLVFFHGGGWVTGDLETHDFQCRLVSRWANCAVVHVNYRHAPEHPFPAAVDDAYAGASWVAANAASLGVDGMRIAVGGDSAGGNLAAAVTLLAAERGTPTFIFQYLAYPVIDAAMDTPSARENATGFGLTADAMNWFWDQYVPDESQRFHPLASPLRAESLQGLPPALVLTAEFDPLRDEGEAYAARLKEAGVPVELKRYDGLVHGFLGQTAETEAARRAMGDLTSALRKAFAGET